VSALAWRRIGYEPIVLITEPQGNTTNFESSSFRIWNITASYLKKFQLTTIKIPIPQNQMNYSTDLSKLARLFIGLLPNQLIQDSDFVMISDSEMIPLSKNYFNFYNSLSIKLLNSIRVSKFVYNNTVYEKFPVSYIGMRKWQWRKVMRVDEVKNQINLTSELVLNKTRVFNNHGDSFLDLDEQMVSVAVAEYVKSIGSKWTRLPLNVSKSRLDRTDSKTVWYRKMGRLDHMVDCRLFAESLNLIRLEMEMERVLELILVLFGVENRTLLSKYISQVFKAF
jgi:hypothetical protein